MRASIIMGLSLLIVFSLGRPTNAAETYWDITEVPEAQITEKDFQFEYGTLDADSLYKRGIYYSGARPSLDTPDTPETIEPRIAPPRSQPRSSTSPAGTSEGSRQSVTPKRTSPQGTEPTDKKPATGRESLKRSESTPRKGPSRLRTEEPKLNERSATKPVTAEHDTKGTDATLGDREKAPLPAPEVRSDKPDDEKLRWGKSEPQAVDNESRVRWGR